MNHVDLSEFQSMYCSVRRHDFSVRGGTCTHNPLVDVVLLSFPLGDK